MRRPTIKQLSKTVTKYKKALDQLPETLRKDLLTLCKDHRGRPPLPESVRKARAKAKRKTKKEIREARRLLSEKMSAIALAKIGATEKIKWRCVRTCEETFALLSAARKELRAQSWNALMEKILTDVEKAGKKPPRTPHRNPGAIRYVRINVALLDRLINLKVEETDDLDEVLFALVVFFRNTKRLR